MKTGNTEEVDEYAILAATWILASNDERSLVTFKGIRHRLNLPKDYDIRALVHRHGELFRRKMPPSELDGWKGKMLMGSSIPSWIRELPLRERTEEINALGPDDGFRSQFRTEAGSPKSEVAVIEWGLNHIERLRKSNIDAIVASVARKQMWLTFLAGLVGSLIGAGGALVGALLKKGL